MRGVLRPAVALVLAALAAAGAAGCATPAEDGGRAGTVTFEGNWDAVLTVVSTNGALLDKACRPLVVGDRLALGVAIAQDGDTVVVSGVPSERWPAFRLTGRSDGDSFDGVGDLTTDCGDVLRLGLRAEAVGDEVEPDRIAGEMTGTRAGLNGRFVFSARRL